MDFVPSALGEPRGPLVGVTLDAVKKPSDTGIQLQGLLIKVVKPICARCATRQSLFSRANIH